MILYALYIINKSGGLIYQQDFHPDAPKMSLNEHLRLGSTFDGLYTITSNLSPVRPAAGGIETLVTNSFRIECFHTATGLKFFATAERQQSGVQAALRAIYTIYTDYVLKNPFYELDQPIRCEMFTQSLKAYLSNAKE